LGDADFVRRALIAHAFASHPLEDRVRQRATLMAQAREIEEIEIIRLRKNIDVARYVILWAGLSHFETAAPMPGTSRSR
jgi:hypothetical protein